MTAEEALLEAWRECRDDARHKPFVVPQINFAYEVGLVTLEQRELWLRRLDTCPGHDDEGGRDWCAYCGTMPREQERTL